MVEWLKAKFESDDAFNVRVVYHNGVSLTAMPIVAVNSDGIVLSGVGERGTVVTYCVPWTAVACVVIEDMD